MDDATLYLSTGMFLLGILVLFYVVRWYREWRMPSAPQITQEVAREMFGDLMSQRLAASMRCAELDKVIVDHWESWPLEYRPALYQVLRHAQLLEETMLEEAMHKGIYPRRVVTQGAAIAPPLEPDRLPPEPSPTRPTDAEDTGATVVPLHDADRRRTQPDPSARWMNVNGQLINTG